MTDGPTEERIEPGEGARLREWFDDPAAHVLLIAEVAQAHDGSLGTAHAYIDVVADAGVDVVKFQTHIADAESTADEPWRVRFSPQDERRIDYWRRMEFEPEQWAGLKEHAEERGLIFLSSPFSLQAVSLLEKLGVEGWKIASGELVNLPLLDRIRDTGKPIVLSTGMSDWGELDRTVARLLSGSERGTRNPLAILQCTSAYPCPPERVGLNLIPELAERYSCPTGLSDHSGTIFPILAGVAQGMRLAEFHVTLSRHAFGPDVPASITPTELQQLVRGVRAIETMLAHPVDKEEVAADLAGMRELFGRSLVAARDLGAGHRISNGDLVLKKPGTGLGPERLDDFVGRRLARGLARDEQLREDDFEHPRSREGSS